jgi:DNA-binding transcriptional LysR family regulator
VELLHRTARTVRLTEVGTLYLEQVRRGIAQLNDADDLVGAPRKDAERHPAHQRHAEGWAVVAGCC